MKLQFDLITHLKKKSYKILKAVEELSKLCKYSSHFQMDFSTNFYLTSPLFTSYYEECVILLRLPSVMTLYILKPFCCL